MWSRCSLHEPCLCVVHFAKAPADLSPCLGLSSIPPVRWPGAFGRWHFLGATGGLGWVSDHGAPNFGEGSQGMNLAASGAHDILGADSANQQGVGNE